MGLARERFENDVKMYGTQTYLRCCYRDCRFENDVKMYGTQTKIRHRRVLRWFENDVKMYGTQTGWRKCSITNSLRMM